MREESAKEYLTRRFPPTKSAVTNLEEGFEAKFWHLRDFEKVQNLSNKIIELLKEEDMTYTDAYAMLGFVHMDLEYRSKMLRL